MKGKYSKTSSVEFEKAIKMHIKPKESLYVKGSYRGNKSHIYVNKDTGLAVITKPNGVFVSGWKLTPDKLAHLFSTGKI